MKQKSKNKQKKQISRLGYILRGFFGGLLLCALAGLLLGYVYLKPYLDELSVYKERAEKIAAASEAEDFKISETSFVYAADGSLISSLSGSRESYYLEYADIPGEAIDCMIVTEDRSFRSHKGYDIKGIVSAVYSYVKTGQIVRGGSTITQQLARNIYLSMEVTMERKTTEIFLAYELERKYTKNQILEFYLNNIYFANGYYGIQAAAVGYFNKNANQLSLSEIAFLCAIPNNPSKYDPLENMENTLERRDKILKQLYEFGGLPKEDYQAALAEEIVLNHVASEKQDYAETYAYYCAIRALMQSNGFNFRTEFTDAEDKEQYEQLYNEEYYAIQRSLYSGGYRIYTSIDLAMQAELQKAVDDELAQFEETGENGVYALQGSAVCIDNESGRVVAIVGGRSQESSGYTLNRAFQSFRQTGSSTKPLLVYTPLFEKGISPESSVLDEYFEGGPKNAGGVYYGEISLREAVYVSANTVAWRLFTELTPEVGLSYLKKMNFSKIVDTDYVPAVSLGGFTYGASALEMAGGFATLANDGVYRTPTCIVSIKNTSGKTLVEEAAKSKRIYSTNSARTMTNVLEDVMTKGTGWRLQLSNAISAGKTGTATGQRDGWFVGYTHYYTTAVWVGYDYPRTMEGLTGSSYPGRIWKNYMEEIHEGLPLVEFPSYTDPAGSGSQTTAPADSVSNYYPAYNAFGEPIDQETGLPYPSE